MFLTLARLTIVNENLDEVSYEAAIYIFVFLIFIFFTTATSFLFRIIDRWHSSDYDRIELSFREGRTAARTKMLRELDKIVGTTKIAAAILSFVASVFYAGVIISYIYG